MPKPLTAVDVPTVLQPGMQVYAPGFAGESAVLVEALQAAPAACSGVRFVGVWIPGINRVDYAALHPTARSTAFFVGHDLRPSFTAGRVDFLPLPYSGIYAYLRDTADIDVAFLHVAAADADGRCSLGVANDFTPAVLSKARLTVAHVNAAMPRTRGATTVAFDDLDYVVEESRPLLAEAPAPADADLAAIGHHIADLVADADTIQIGVGRIQAVLGALAGKRGLMVHGGMITESVKDLVDAGAIADVDGAITTGVAWGDADLYDWVADNPRVRFAPVAHTHDPAVLAAIPRLIAINSVIEVDLLGQANAEAVGGRQISSAGGLVDFLRGARASPGGLPIVALASTAKGGAVSRIVPEFTAGAPVSVARGDMGLVVTEHGVADLRGKSVDARAEALIAVADPRFRDDLRAAWDRRRAAM